MATAKEEDYSDLALPASGHKADDEDYSDLALPTAEYKANKERSFLSKLPFNILAGLAQGGHMTLNAPHNIISAISPSLGAHIPKQRDYDYANLVGLPSESTLSDKLIRSLAQYAPSAAIPEVRGAESILGKIAANAAPQAAFGATQTENPLEGAAYGAVGGAIAPIAGILKPSNLFRGNLSPEALAANAEAVRGTETGLGRVIDSPTLNRLYENILPHVLLSGAENTMQRNANLITKKGEDLLENIRGDIQPGDYGQKLKLALQEASKDATKEKEAGYSNLNNAADKIGLKVGRENFSNEAKSILDEINKSPELKAETDKKLIDDLERYASNKEGNNLKTSNIFRGKIGDKANEAYMTPGKSHEYSVYKRLKDSLKSDIDDAFEKSNNPELKNIYAQNQKDYAEKFAPFEHPDIVKFTRQGGDPDLLLPHFIRRGPNDRAYLLSKLTKSLEKQGNLELRLPAYAYLSKAVDENGQLNPVKLSTLYNVLGKNQKKALIKDENIRNQLNNYTNLVSKNKEAFNLMFNPKTGARNSDLLIKLTQLISGSAVGGLPGILGTLAGSALAGRFGTKLLTSPGIRERLIKAMIEKKPAFSTNVTSAATQSALAPNNPEPMTLELNKFKGYQ